MGSDLFQKLSEKYPFITLCIYASNEYVGIVQNRDDAVTTIYDYGSIIDPLIKEKFLELGDKKIVRVNIIGNIVDKYTSEGEKKYGFFTLDDGSGQIKLKSFVEKKKLFF